MIGLMFQVRFKRISAIVCSHIGLNYLHFSNIKLGGSLNTFSFVLLHQATTKVAAVFIAPQHNLTRTVNGMSLQATTFKCCYIFLFQMILRLFSH